MINKHGRNYITPEDVREAADSGVNKLELTKIVLDHINLGLVEDTSLTAWVMLQVLKE